MDIYIIDRNDRVLGWYVGRMPRDFEAGASRINLQSDIEPPSVRAITGDESIHDAIPIKQAVFDVIRPNYVRSRYDRQVRNLPVYLTPVEPLPDDFFECVNFLGFRSD